MLDPASHAGFGTYQEFPSQVAVAQGIAVVGTVDFQAYGSFDGNIYAVHKTTGRSRPPHS